MAMPRGPASSSSPALDRTAEEKAIWDVHLNAAVGPGQTWYLVCADWYNKWRDFVERPITTRSPGEINNARLVQQESSSSRRSQLGSPKLRRNLQETHDYELCCEEVWMKLKTWYGGGPEFARATIVENRQHKIEVYLTRIKIKYADTDIADDEYHSIEISANATVAELKNQGSALLHLSSGEVRLFVRNYRANIVLDETDTIGEALYSFGQHRITTCDSQALIACIRR